MEGRKRRHQKKSKKTNKPNTTTAAKVTKKRNNGESSKSKKIDRKSKKGSTKLVEVSLDPPSLIAKLTLPGCKGGRNEPAQGALDFWKFVDAYTSVITAEDMNYINQLANMYSKENCLLFNIPPSNVSSSSFRSLNLPDNWVERIVGALVDPDLFPSEEEDRDSKRIKFCDPSETAGVFSDRSNFPAYLNVGPVYTSEDGEEMTNCDMKSNQDQSDEISLEIFKCQEELKLLCRENATRLSQLSSRAQRELESQHLKQNLAVCENELVKLMQQKHNAPRLKKETVTSAWKKFRDEEADLIQRRELLIASLRNTQGFP
ncbi:uncharacterized protein LOC103514290 [Diaphorina citri]|uniref:Uncharacterized protein LOC103514290 n=1 Tax=Diaphorina citri TaxID=121845 RepID=A0A3Q0J8R6_DIACI|nr:uncharacterized protein LOC103514290 [Diaphorina citri]